MEKNKQQSPESFKDMIADSSKHIYIGRDSEVRRLQQILERRSKNHPLLVGDAGVGKKSIVGLLAQKIANKEVSKNLINTKMLRLDTSSLLIGSKLKGEIDDRFKKAIDSINPNDDVIVFIDNIESIPTTDFLKSMFDKDIRFIATATTDGFKKLQEKDLYLINQFTVLTIEPPDVQQSIEILRGIAHRYESYHKVRVGEPAIESAVKLAKRYVQDRCLPDSAIDLLDEACSRKSIENNGMPFDLDAVLSKLNSLKNQKTSLVGDDDQKSTKVMSVLDKEISELEPKVSLMRREVNEGQDMLTQLTTLRNNLQKFHRQLVMAKNKEDYKTVGILEHKLIPETTEKIASFEKQVEEMNIKERSNIVTENDIGVILGDWTGIPVSKMLESETEKLIQMEDRLEKRVVGQNEAVRALAKAVRRGRVGLRDAKKPIGSFLFLGSSGTGKTETAKALAEFLFDDEHAMTRIDMSEFMEKHMAQRLVGAPPGYANAEEGGFLTEAVRHRPYSVLLFDEVEKAHPDVFNLLLQVLDDGRLTDGRGRLADFSNTVVIMTSNIGSKNILDADPDIFDTEDGIAEMSQVLRDELKKFLRPEFLNRIDETIIFRPLSKNHLRGILDIQLNKVERLVSDRELKLHLSESAKQELVNLSYEPAFGARPLNRSITKHIQNPMAEEILSGGYKNGDTIHIDCVSGKFIFRKK